MENVYNQPDKQLGRVIRNNRGLGKLLLFCIVSKMLVPKVTISFNTEQIACHHLFYAGNTSIIIAWKSNLTDDEKLNMTFSPFEETQFIIGIHARAITQRQSKFCARKKRFFEHSQVNTRVIVMRRAKIQTEYEKSSYLGFSNI